MMKRPLLLSLILILITAACSFASPSPAAPPPAPTIASVPPTSIPAEASPAAAPSSNDATLLYISGTTHIETKPQTWPNVDAFLAFLQKVADLGMKWSVGADVGWLEGEPRAAELIQASEALGVQWDIHAHSGEDRAKAAYLITQMGGHPNSVVSGMLVDELDSVRQPLTYQGFTWTPKVLWGGTNCVGHRPGCDDLSAGIWIPLSSEQYATHDPNGTLVRVGGGTHQLDDGRALAQAVANGQYQYPIISFTVMVTPATLTIFESGDGIAEISAFVNEMNQYSFVRWANIEETAQAWTAAGSVPSRIDQDQ
ncbi:MAG: hypothetical protein HY864_04460 [Chloroflexi bacterium]|nr:hypothetical protein [Chloroflexota bacterium]